MNTSDARPNQKETYAKPLLTKHGNLKDITSTVKVGSSGRKPVEALGCTRM
jgi:hypothetical protein